MSPCRWEFDHGDVLSSRSLPRPLCPAAQCARWTSNAHNTTRRRSHSLGWLSWVPLPNLDGGTRGTAIFAYPFGHGAAAASESTAIARTRHLLGHEAYVDGEWLEAIGLYLGRGPVERTSAKSRPSLSPTRPR